MTTAICPVPDLPTIRSAVTIQRVASTPDAVWSDRYTRKIEATRLGAGRHVEAHYFEGEGHGFSAEAHARLVALRRTFLEAHLRRG